MLYHTLISSYLAQVAEPAVGRKRSLTRWFRSTFRRAPKLHAKTAVGLASWVMMVVVIAGAAGTANLQSPSGGLYASGTAQAAGRAVTTAAVLPGGPTGQLLPPGTLAAPYAYANSYSRGQCTWYVAGRRPIPRGWGNAATWYGRARAAGWGVGSKPAVGAVAWTSSGSYGHVALVEAIDGSDVLVSEMNYLGTYKIDKRWVRATSFQYIY